MNDRLVAALADRYRLERELGQGGMATVYLARDLRHDRNVSAEGPRLLFGTLPGKSPTPRSSAVGSLSSTPEETTMPLVPLGWVGSRRSVPRARPD